MKNNNSALAHPSILQSSISRRTLLVASSAMAVVSAGLTRAAAVADGDVETIEITPALIEAAKREGTLLMRYSSPVNEVQTMADGFKKAFGIGIQLDRKVGILGNQQFATEERVGRHVMDVNGSADPQGVTELGSEGLYLKFTLKDIDKKLGPGMALSNLGYCARTSDVVISYNPKLIPHARAKDVFKTWRGLLDPSLRGKIGMTEPGGGGIPFTTYFMFYKRPEYGREFLVKLMEQQPRVYKGSAPGREDLAAGAISVFIPDFESAAMDDFAAGGQTAWTYPEIAPSYANGFLCISKNAPHPNAARLLVAWHFTPEGAQYLQKNQQRPTLLGVVDERPAIAKLKQTDWWTPYPDAARWSPDPSEVDANYQKLLVDMRTVMGWQ